MLTTQTQVSADINLDSREFFAGPQTDAWLNSRLGVMYLIDEVQREFVDVIKLSDIFGPGRRIMASMGGGDVRSYPTDEFSWVRSRRDGSIGLISNAEIGSPNEREQLELLSR